MASRSPCFPTSVRNISRSICTETCTSEQNPAAKPCLQWVPIQQGCRRCISSNVGRRRETKNGKVHCGATPVEIIAVCFSAVSPRSEQSGCDVHLCQAFKKGREYSRNELSHGMCDLPSCAGKTVPDPHPQEGGNAERWSSRSYRDQQPRSDVGLKQNKTATCPTTCAPLIHR